MEAFHFDDYGLVMTRGGNFPLQNLSKKCKTRTIRNNDGFSIVLNVESIKIAPETYWHIGNYDHQFEQNDANCYLCGWYGGTGGTCKCKKTGFTIDEHSENVLKARRRFFKTVMSNYFPKLIKLAKTLSDEEINDLLYEDHPMYGYKLLLYLPSWSVRDKVVVVMKERLETFKLL